MQYFFTENKFSNLLSQPDLVIRNPTRAKRKIPPGWKCLGTLFVAKMYFLFDFIALTENTFAGVE
jgi:hypothetical protein